MPVITGSVKGATELQKTLREAGADIEELRKVNEAAAEVVMRKSERLAPVLTGKLKQTLRVGATKRAGIVRAGNNRKTETGVPYAGPIHWGWPKRGIVANPFMVDAAHLTESQWTELFIKHAEDTLGHVKGM